MKSQERNVSMYANQKKLRGSALIEHTHKSTELALGTLLCLEGVFGVMSNKMDEDDSIDPSEIPDDCPEDLVFDVEDDIIHRAIIDWTPTSNIMKIMIFRSMRIKWGVIYGMRPCRIRFKSS